MAGIHFLLDCPYRFGTLFALGKDSLVICLSHAAQPMIISCKPLVICQSNSCTDAYFPRISKESLSVGENIIGKGFFFFFSFWF